jgi:hypothetical protein
VNRAHSTDEDMPPSVAKKSAHHDVNNLLMIIIGNAEILSHDVTLESHLHNLRAIVRAAYEIDRILGQ